MHVDVSTSKELTIYTKKKITNLYYMQYIYQKILNVFSSKWIPMQKILRNPLRLSSCEMIYEEKRW